MTHVNDQPVNDLPNNPFRAEKNSGIGRFGGQWAIRAFTSDHWITVQHKPRPYPLDANQLSDLPVHLLGFGTMRLTGPGIWGEPKDPNEARSVLRRAIELNVNFIDTADSYGPEVAERLIGETLFPYPKGLVVATKGGLTRQVRTSGLRSVARNTSRSNSFLACGGSD